MSSFVTKSQHDQLTAQLQALNPRLSISQADGYAGDQETRTFILRLSATAYRHLMLISSARRRQIVLSAIARARRMSETE
jgi:prephenate dehydrogenase